MTWNGDASELEAGGKISGTCQSGLLSFTDAILHEELPGKAIRFYIGDAKSAPGVAITSGFDNFVYGVKVIAYEPPKPKPWWETCPDDAWIEVDSWGGGYRFAVSVQHARGLGPSLAPGNPRRVHVSDYDTTVVVPRKAVDRLRDCVKRNLYTGAAARGLVAAVNEAGDTDDH